MRSRRACRARPNRWSSPRSWLHEHGADKHAVHSCNGYPMNRQAPISPAQREEAGLLEVLPLAATGQAGEGACDVAFPPPLARDWATALRSEEHTSELQSLMRLSYAVFCLNKTKKTTTNMNEMEV